MSLNEKTNILLVATSDGLIIGEINGQWWRKTLTGLSVAAVIAREGVILAGTNQGIWRSDDQGKTWYPRNLGLTEQGIRWLSFHPHISDYELAGTVSGRVFVSRDGAATWRPLDTRDTWGAALALEEGGMINALTTNAEALFENKPKAI